ncbi:nitrogen permease regulator 2-domain-containing protein [Paraphysoderma sedebokerense]|nr:nitrogen permease regulator 2-domain-containing protein [Paraphysoderma sedebokerense]
MDQLIDDLNNYKETHITVNDANEINIKLFPVYKNPPKVEDYHVPIALINLKSIMHGDWDMTMQRILPYIDGVSYVKWISEQSSVDINLVKLCIQHLLYYGVVNIVDIFSFSNIYRATPGLRSLPLSDNLQLECLSYVTKPGCTPPAAVDLLAWIGAFRVGVTVKQWIEGNSIPMDTIDVRRLVVFAVLKGWLKRVYSYPIYSASNGPIGNSNDGRQNTDTESWTSEAAGSEQRQSRGHSHTTKKTLHSSYPSQTQAAPKNQLRRYFNGTHHTDELCVLFALTPKELEDYLSKDINIKIIMK